MKMKYDEVVEALFSERNYQLRRWGHRQPDGRLVERPCDLFGWVTYMTYYFRVAQHIVSTSADDADATEVLRKVVAMAVAAMEGWSTPANYAIQAATRNPAEFVRPQPSRNVSRGWVLPSAGPIAIASAVRHRADRRPRSVTAAAADATSGPVHSRARRSRPAPSGAGSIDRSSVPRTSRQAATWRPGSGPRPRRAGWPSVPSPSRPAPR